MLGTLTADSHIMVCWKSKSIEAGMAERSSNAVLIRLQITGTSESVLAENGADSVCAAVAFIAGTISKTAVLLPTAASLTICPRPTAPAPPRSLPRLVTGSIPVPPASCPMLELPMYGIQPMDIVNPVGKRLKWAPTQS